MRGPLRGRFGVTHLESATYERLLVPDVEDDLAVALKRAPFHDWATVHAFEARTDRTLERSCLFRAIREAHAGPFTHLPISSAGRWTLLVFGNSVFEHKRFSVAGKE